MKFKITGSIINFILLSRSIEVEKKIMPVVVGTVNESIHSKEKIIMSLRVGDSTYTRYGRMKIDSDQNRHKIDHLNH